VYTAKIKAVRRTNVFCFAKEAHADVIPELRAVWCLDHRHPILYKRDIHILWQV
jgi:hypothetical protein